MKRFDFFNNMIDIYLIFTLIMFAVGIIFFNSTLNKTTQLVLALYMMSDRILRIKGVNDDE